MGLLLTPAVFNLDIKIKLLAGKPVKALSGELKNINTHSQAAENPENSPNKLDQKDLKLWELPSPFFCD